MKKQTALFPFLLLSISLVTVDAQETGTVSDIDNNVYKTIIIGKYVWMADSILLAIMATGGAVPGIEHQTPGTGA
jgi:phosphatidate phosphatase APP1